SEVERRAGRGLGPDEPLPPALPQELERAVVAKGVVPGAAEEHMRGPRAAGAAGVRVIAGPTMAPEILDRPGPRELERLRALPAVPQPVVADVAAHVISRRQRGTALDVPVRLDPERGSPGAARGHVPPRQRAPELGLVRTEITDVVARPEPHLGLVRPRLD